MCRVKAPLITAFERSMGGDEHAIFEDADLIGEYVNIEDYGRQARGWKP